MALANPNTDVWTVSILSCIRYSLLMSVYIKYKSRFTYYTCKSILQIQTSNCFLPFHLQFSTLNFLLTSNQRILKFRLQIHISRAGLKVSFNHLFVLSFCNITLVMVNPMACMSLPPGVVRSLVSCCSRDTNTSSSSSFTSNTYYNNQIHVIFNEMKNTIDNFVPPICCLIAQCNRLNKQIYFAQYITSLKPSTCPVFV